jgi:small subunit ribosomal protein S21
MKVKVRNNNVDKALSIFKRKTGDVVYEVRQREHYEKPTDARRRARKLAIIKERKRQEDQVPKRR